MWTLVCGRNKNKCNDKVKVAAKIVNAKVFACELLGKEGWYIGVVLYGNQWSVYFILHFAELHISSSIR